MELRAALGTTKFDEDRYLLYKIESLGIAEMDFSAGLSSFENFICSAIKTLATREVRIHFTEDGRSVASKSDIYVTTSPLNSGLTTSASLEVIAGLAIHELAHIMYTKVLETPERIKAMTRIEHQFQNILEDRRIENLIASEHPGFTRALMSTRHFFAINLLREGDFDAETEREAFGKYVMLNVLYNYLEPISSMIYSFVDTEKMKEACNKLSTDLSLLYSKFSTYLSVEDTGTLSDIINTFDLDEETVLENALKLSNIYVKLPARESDKPSDLHLVGRDEAEKLQQEDNVVTVVTNALSKNDESKSAATIKSLLLKDDAKFSADAKKEEPTARKESDGSTKEAPIIKISRELMKDTTIEEQLNEPVIYAEVPKAASYAKDYKHISNVLSCTATYVDRVKGRQNLQFELMEGDLDEDALHEARITRDIFYDDATGKGLSQEIIILLDISGSMCGRSDFSKGKSKIEFAKVIMKGLLEGFNKQRNIKTQAYAFDADDPKSRTTRIHVLKDTKTKFEDAMCKVESLTSKSNNTDARAIAEVATKFTQRSGEKILIVISDGEPASVSAGGQKGIEAVRKVVTDLERQHVKVLSVAIDNISQQEEMYTNFIPANNKVGEMLTQWLKNNLRAKIIK